MNLYVIPCLSDKVTFDPMDFYESAQSEIPGLNNLQGSFERVLHVLEAQHLMWVCHGGPIGISSMFTFYVYLK